MHREGDAVYVTSSEVEAVPGRHVNALKNHAGGYILQRRYQGENPVSDGRAWRPTATAAAEWEATVPIGDPSDAQSSEVKRVN